jgi:hypothetical protein
MVWNFIPVKGSAGGILLGFRNSTIEILECHGFEFSAVAVVKNKHDNLVWRLIVVYGSPYEEFKVAFLEELEVVMTRWQGPTLVGGRGLILSETKGRRTMVWLILTMLACSMNGSTNRSYPPWSCPYTEPSWSHGTHLAAHTAPEHRSQPSSPATVVVSLHRVPPVRPRSRITSCTMARTPMLGPLLFLSTVAAASCPLSCRATVAAHTILLTPSTRPTV